MHVLYVCMYICIYEYMYVTMYLCTYVRKYVCMYVCINRLNLTTVIPPSLVCSRSTSDGSTCCCKALLPIPTSKRHSKS